MSDPERDPRGRDDDPLPAGPPACELPPLDDPNPAAEDCGLAAHPADESLAALGVYEKYREDRSRQLGSVHAS